MPEQIDLRQVWNNNRFRVYRGKLKGRTLLQGSSLGQGLIYYTSPANVEHLISAGPGDEATVQLKSDRQNQCIWNPGHLTRVRNAGSNPVELLRVAPKYRRDFIKTLPKDTVAAATTLLVSSDWPDSFREAIEVDLRAIGTLALSLRGNEKPTLKQILRARAAQDDFEFKLEWIVKSFGGFFEPLNFLRNLGWSGGGGRGRRSLLGRKAPPFDPSVRVTVNTKDETGTKEVSGCEVYANYAGLLDKYDDAHRFPGFSTPAQDAMNVGHYIMWTKKQGAIGERSRIEIGTAGQKTQSVDLYAPKA